MKINKKKFQKKYANFRRLINKPDDKPRRLVVSKAKWKNNAHCPVILMIDDLANAWHGKENTDCWDNGGDWGGGLDREDGSIAFLQENLLKNHPEIKVTFFAVAGKLVIGNKDMPFSFSEALNFNEASRKFFRALDENNSFEIAYHGFTHGQPGKKKEDFVQEWRSFSSVDEAVRQNNRGRELLKEVLGRYPAGGKYGGWKYNEFADESIDESGFMWWCRDWMPRDVGGSIDDSYYDPQFFGDNFVLALPSTIHGFHWTKKQIDALLSKKQIISIEEHIAPLRPDGLVQAPNIFDDIGELNQLYTYLKDKKVWHANGTEIAEYYLAHFFTTIYDIQKEYFKIKYSGMLENPCLTVLLALRFEQGNDKFSVVQPDGEAVECQYEKDSGSHKANIKVANGTYRVLKG